LTSASPPLAFAAASGIELLGRSAQAQPPEWWVVEKAATKERVAQVQQRWGFTPLPPGEYRLTLVLRGQQEFVEWGPVTVTKDQVTTVTVASGIDASGGPQQPPPEAWFVDEATTKKRVAQVQKRWGFLPLPPGTYRLTLLLRGQQEFVEWGSVTVTKDQVTPLNAAAGITLTGGSQQPPPEWWGIEEATTKKRIAQVQKRWGFLPLPPGTYRLVLVPQGPQTLDVPWGSVTVAKDHVTTIDASSGIDLTGGVQPPPPELWVVENLETQKRVAQMPQRWGFTPLPPGRYAVKAFFANLPERVREVTVTAGRVTMLPVAALGLVQILAGDAPAGTFDAPAVAGQYGLSLFQLTIGDPAATAAQETQVTVLDATGQQLLAVIPNPPPRATWLTPPQPLVRVRLGQREQAFRDIPIGKLLELTANPSAGRTGRAPGASPLEVDIVIEAPPDGALVPHDEVTVIGRAATTTRAGATQIALVIDASGSTTDPSGADLDGDGKEDSILEAEVAAVRILLDKLVELEAQSPGTAFAVTLVRFADDAEVMVPLRRMTDAQGVAALYDALGRILRTFRGGKTYYNKALDAALAAFEDANLPGPRVILFMSDGKPSELLPSLAAAARAGLGEAVIHTFGLGKDFRGTPPATIVIPPYPTDGVSILATVAKLGAAGGAVIARPRPADVVQIIPRLPVLELPDVALQEVQVVNQTTGKAALQVDLTRDGAFQARVPVSLLPTGRHASNTLVATAIATDGVSTATAEVRVRSEPDREEPPQPPIPACPDPDTVIGDLKARIVALEQDNTRCNVTQQTLAAECDKLAEALKAVQADRDQLATTLRQTQADLTAARTRLTDLERAVATGVAERDTLRREKTDLTKAKIDLQTALDALRAAHDKLAEALKTVQADRDQLATVLRTTQDELTVARRDSVHLKGERDKCAADLTAARADIRRLETESYHEVRRLTYCTVDKDRCQAALKTAQREREQCTDVLQKIPGTLRITTVGEHLPPALVPQFELILDASNSMWGQVKGQAKIASAKDVMTRIIQRLPASTQAALRLYGHRLPISRPGACQDSELVFPFAPIDKPRLLQVVQAIKPRGTTPIAHSLRQVASDFRHVPGAKVVVLVTDGIEECGGSPSAAVAELQAQGLQVKIHVVGFALAEETAKQEMERIAQLTGGLFFDAQDVEELRQALEQALTVPYEVLDAAGKTVGGSTLGRGALALPGGSYTVVVLAPDKPITIRNVQVAPNRVTQVELKSEGQGLGIRVDGP
jgi:hypothetical protein